MDLRLWVVDLGPHPLDPTVWWPLLDPVERAAAGAERRAGDRARYVVRHVVLRTILGDALGLAPAAVLLDRAPGLSHRPARHGRRGRDRVRRADARPGAAARRACGC